MPILPPLPASAARLASGRACDVFDLGDGTVLRRRRDGSSAEGEAQVMRWAADHGVPVPSVVDVDGPDLVLQRLEGPTLLEPAAVAMVSPAQSARIVAGLHRALDEVPAPPGLAPLYDAGPHLLHGDLHPGNVVLTGDGPVLIDWTDASAGHRGADVAETWLLTACFDPGDEEWEAGRRAFLGPFLAAVDAGEAARWLPRVAARRLADPHTSPAEAEAIRALCAGGLDPSGHSAPA